MKTRDFASELRLAYDAVGEIAINLLLEKEFASQQLNSAWNWYLPQLDGFESLGEAGVWPEHPPFAIPGLTARVANLVVA